jgi:hypothetical protein
MATYDYIKGQTDLTLAGTWGTAVASWSNGDSARMQEGGPVTLTNVTAMAGKTLDAFTVTPGCSVQLGSESGYMSLNVNSTPGTSAFDYNGRAAGPCYIRGGTAKEISVIVWRPVSNILGRFIDIVNATLRVLSGSCYIGDDATVAAIETYGSSVTEIATHASDTIADCKMFDRSTLTMKRRLAGAITVPPGCTLNYDVDTTTTTSQSVTLAGGTLVVRKGSMVVVGGSGILDLRNLERAGYTITLTGCEGLTILRGPTSVTITETKVGKGATYA